MAGRRIAHKVFLGYFLPLAVLLVAGVLIPLALSSALARAHRSYEETVRFVDQVQGFRQAAFDAENQFWGYILHRDAPSQRKFREARIVYRLRYNDIRDFLDVHPNAKLSRQLNDTEIANTAWLRYYALPQIQKAERAPRQEPRRVGISIREMEAERKAFSQVRSRLDSLLSHATAYRDGLLRGARAGERFWRITMLAVPPLALALALLLGRSIARGITRPLETLTQATFELERGSSSARLLLDAEVADDEIGDLQKAFTRMARTIGQREAVLRAQTEAVGALHRRIEAVLNATNDGILMLDRAGGFSVVNRRLGELFGLEPDVLLDQTFDQAGPLLISRFRDKNNVRQRFKGILNDPDLIADEVFDIIEPVGRTLRVYSAPVLSETTGRENAPQELLGRIFVFRDVTRETVVDRMKTEFVSTVSHELRTPLTAIKGYVDLLVSGQTGALNEIQSEFLTVVQGSTRRLTSLINDMLDISRIESGRMDVRQESVDFARIVRETVQMMAREAAAKQISLGVEVAAARPAADTRETDTVVVPPVSGDADRITQVLVNLLSNGIKYTPPGGSVRIVIEPEESIVTTSIVDTGIGISQEDLRRLFQKFFRADNSTTRQVGGTGLGLAITRAILEKMNGSIWVESTPGRGSRFCFTLPVAPELTPAQQQQQRRAQGAAVIVAAAAAAAEPSTNGFTTRGEEPEETPARERSGQQRRRMVLSVEENPTLLHLLGHHLRRHGFTTVSARNGDEALSLAHELQPDLITLDLALGSSDGIPGAAAVVVDGFTLLRRLRVDPATRDIPVLLMAVQAASEAGQDAVIHGGVSFFPRPFDEPSLRQHIRSVLAAATQSQAQTIPTVLVVGETLSEALKRLLMSAEMRLETFGSLHEAEAVIAAQVVSPALVLIDPADGEESGVGRVAAALRRRSDTERVPLLVAVETVVCGAESGPLPSLGDGPVSIEHFADAVGKIVRLAPVEEHAREKEAATP